MPSTTATTTAFSNAEEFSKELKLSTNMTPFRVPSSPLFVPVNAYLVPLLVLCTFVINAMVCIVLLKPHIRSTTNTILTAMAVADTLTGLSPLPCYLYFYTRGHYREWVTFNWCYIYFCLTDFLPSIFHTASIWLTVALAVQRYISVCHTETARWLCTIRKAVLAAGCLLLVATLSQVGRFVEMDYHPVLHKSRLASENQMFLHGEGIKESVQSLTTTDNGESMYEARILVGVQEKLTYSEHIASALSSWPISDALDYKDDYMGYISDNYSGRSDDTRLGQADINDSESSYIVGCSYSVTKALKPHQHIYFNAYYIFRILFIHIIPCLTLIVINGLLLKTMREGQNRRTRLLKMNRLTESRRLAEVNRTTLMLVIVVALFLFVEVPSACLFVVVVLENSFDLALLTSEAGAEAATTVINLVILLSYPMNFFIYCAMSTQFRSGFIHLFKRDSDDNNHQQRRKSHSVKNAADNCFKSSIELPVSKDKRLREAGACSIPSGRKVDEV